MNASVDVDVIQADWDGPRWFGAKVGRVAVRALGRSASGVLAQAFARDIKDDGLTCGAGVGQIGKRHLFYVGVNSGRPRVGLGFLWLTRSVP